MLAKQIELEQQIKALDRDLKTTASLSILKKLEAACSALDQLLSQKAESFLLSIDYSNLAINLGGSWLD